MGVLVFFALLCLAQVHSQCTSPPDLSKTTGYTAGNCTQANAGALCSLTCAPGYGLNGTLFYQCSSITGVLNVNVWVSYGMGGICVPCPEGTFSQGGFDARCSPCPSGTTSRPASAQCVQVTAGCDPATTCNSHGQCAPQNSSSSPCFCAPYFSGNNCNQCSFGTYPECGCAPGTYTTTTATSNGQMTYGCASCLPGTFSAVRNAQGCPKCQPGFFSSNDRSTTCTACSSNTFNPSYGASTCTNCPQYSTSPAGSPTCFTDCAPGNFLQRLSDNTTVCTPCAAGYYSRIAGDRCFPCPAGSFSIAQSAQCTPCPVNTYTPYEGLVACVPCASGYITTGVNSTYCIAASQACPLAYVRVDGSSTCVPCPVGRFYDLIAQNCIPCAPGTFQDQVASLQCNLCPINTFSPNQGASSCLACQNDTVSLNPGSLTCIPPPTSICAEGNYLDANKNCLACSPGFFSNIKNAERCIPAPVGYYIDTTGATSASQCPQNTFSASQGQTSCTACPNGTVSNTGALTCSSSQICVAGTFWNGQTCAKCAPGRFNAVPFAVSDPAVTSECLLCPVGTAQPESGAATCRSCPPGTFSARVGSISCTNCSIDFYNPWVSQSTCLACAAPLIAPQTGSAFCVNNQSSTPPTSGCAPGSYSTGQSCAFCPPGTFSPSMGALECTRCAVGRFAPNNGSVQCFACPKGSFSANVGARLCSRCQYGTYAPQEGSSSCQNCPSVIVGTDAQAAPSCGYAICTPSCADNQVCTYDGAGTSGYSLPSCRNVTCNPSCLETQRCLRGLCVVPPVNLSQTQVNVLASSGIDVNSLVGSSDLSLQSLDGTTPIRVPGNTFLGLSAPNKTQVPPLSFGSDGGASDASLYVRGDILTPGVVTNTMNALVLLGRNCTFNSTGRLEINGNGGNSGFANFRVSFEDQGDRQGVFATREVSISSGGALFVDGGKVQLGIVTGEAGGSVNVRSSVLSGEIRQPLVTALLRGDDGTPGNISVEVGRVLRTDANIVGGGRIVVDGELEFNRTGGRIHADVNVTGSFVVVGDVNVTGDVRFDGILRLQSGTNPVPVPPFFNRILDCTANHTIQYQVPGLDDITKLSGRGVVLNFSEAQVSKFECMLEILDKANRSVSVQIDGGAMTAPGARRLLATSSISATWEYQGLSYTGQSSGAFQQASISFFVLAILGLLSIVLM